MLRLDALVDSPSFTLRTWRTLKPPRRAAMGSKLMDGESGSTFPLRRGLIRRRLESTWENQWIGRGTGAPVEVVVTNTETAVIVVLHLHTVAEAAVDVATLDRVHTPHVSKAPRQSPLLDLI